jgi:hypothetical protein
MVLISRRRRKNHFVSFAFAIDSLTGDALKKQKTNDAGKQFYCIDPHPLALTLERSKMFQRRQAEAKAAVLNPVR